MAGYASICMPLQGKLKTQASDTLVTKNILYALNLACSKIATLKKDELKVFVYVGDLVNGTVSTHGC